MLRDRPRVCVDRTTTADDCQGHHRRFPRETVSGSERVRAPRLRPAFWGAVVARVAHIRRRRTAHSVAPLTPSLRCAARLLLVAVEDEAAVGAAKAKGVRHDAIHLAVIALSENFHALRLGYQLLDVCTLGEEALLEHEQRIDRLVHARRAERVPRQR